jgi:hypothetical protein
VGVIAVLWLLATLQSSFELRIEAPPELDPARARLAAIGTERLADLVSLVGLAEPGPPIPVVLAAETSEWARSTSAWTAGLAIGGERIVLFPARSPVYPHDTLEDVLRHEVMHVLIARATRGRRVPRWFNEGVAMHAERPWALRDTTRVGYALAVGPTLTLDEVGALFAGDRNAQSRAYALAGAFVRTLFADHGRTVVAQLLARVADEVPFEDAYAQVTGQTLGAAEARFWREQRLWTTWVPLATSTTMLWLMMTLLALYVARRRRRARAALHRQWAAEEAAYESEEPPLS